MMDDKFPQVTNNGLTDAVAFDAFNAAHISMVLTDPHGPDHPIIYANRAFEETTGFTARSAIGRNCRFLQGPETDPEDVARLRAAIDDQRDVTVDLLNYRSDGGTFMNRLMISPVFNDAGRLTYFLGIQRPISAEEDSLSPNALRNEMREIQHRVKNHLALIVSLIRMHGRDAGDAQRQFDVLSRRVESLQVLYEELSNPERIRNMDSVSLGAYLSRLVHAMNGFDGRPGIRMNVAVDDVQVPTDLAVNIGLVTSEILTNALKHAFVGRESGLVELRLTRVADRSVRIIVSDDGVGVAKGVDWPNNDSVGGRVIQGLIQQLGGKVAILRGGSGTVVTLELPNVAY